MTTATKTKTATKTIEADPKILVPSSELVAALDAEQAAKDADALVAEHDRAHQTVPAKGAIETTQDEQVEAEAKAPAKTKTVAERVAKVKAEKAPQTERVAKVKTEKAPQAKVMHPKTAARLQWILDTPGKHSVSDVRRGTPEVSPYDRATRDSLRQLVTAGRIATGKSEGGVEVFFALPMTEAPAK